MSNGMKWFLGGLTAVAGGIWVAFKLIDKAFKGWALVLALLLIGIATTYMTPKDFKEWLRSPPAVSQADKAALERKVSELENNERVRVAVEAKVATSSTPATPAAWPSELVAATTKVAQHMYSLAAVLSNVKVGDGSTQVCRRAFAQVIEVSNHLPFPNNKLEAEIASNVLSATEAVMKQVSRLCIVPGGGIDKITARVAAVKKPTTSTTSVAVGETRPLDDYTNRKCSALIKYRNQHADGGYFALAGENDAQYKRECAGHKPS